ncbi:hypothetical protein FOA52_007524 [Chlamydomonas sp. UWO 241]|nr:hypothetical protein FOA52_007524 [Chlamydomonas sp. UWO 241]
MPSCAALAALLLLLAAPVPTARATFDWSPFQRPAKATATAGSASADGSASEGGGKAAAAAAAGVSAGSSSSSGDGGGGGSATDVPGGAANAPRGHKDRGDGGGAGGGGEGGGEGEDVEKENYWTRNLYVAACTNKPKLPKSMDMGTEGGLPEIGSIADRRYGGCAYGSLPGYWDQEPGIGTGARWVLIDRQCQTTSRIHRHMRHEDKCPRGPSTRARILLLLGDSVDRGLIDAICRYTTSELLRCGGVRLIQPSCGDVLFSTIHLFGSAMEGPWHMSVNETYEQILGRAVDKDWRGGMHLPDPDLIVLNSNMWDIARALALLEAGLDNAFNQTLLPAAFIDSWMANVTRYVGYVQSLFPNSVIGWHTISIGEVQKDGSMRHFTLGKKSFIVQLNAAGRAVAQQLGLVLIDYEAITAGFHDNRYLMDQHHPTDKIQMEVASVYLDLLNQLPLVPTAAPGECAPMRGTAAPEGVYAALQ